MPRCSSANKGLHAHWYTTTCTSSHIHVRQPPYLAHTHKTNCTYPSTFKTHFSITPIYHNLQQTDTQHTHYRAMLASLHSSFSVSLLSVGPCLHLTLCLSPLLTTPFMHMASLLGHTKLISCFWSYKSLKNDQATKLFFFETEVERKWCTNKCIVEGEVWGQDYKMWTIVYLRSQNMKLGWWSHWVQVV